ncbi:MAG: isoprenyl transferase [Planctomycetota bacterium]
MDLEAQTQALAEMGLTADKLPRHVAIIMDGNGRWAQRRGMPRIEGHRRGVHSVRRVVEEGCRLGLAQLTLYCLSIENWKRPKLELDQLMRLLRRYLIDERPTIMKQNVRLQVIGRREGLPDSVIKEMDKSIEMSASNTGMTLCLAINYGGRTELIDAVRTLARKTVDGVIKPFEIDEAAIESALYTHGMPDPDLLIRTAGEMRVSNFLLWQISYAEIWITETCWPDFLEQHLRDAITTYAKRERRYGGLNG